MSIWDPEEKIMVAIIDYLEGVNTETKMNTNDPQAPYRLLVDMPPPNHDEGVSDGWDHTSMVRIIEPGMPEHDALTKALFPNMNKPTARAPMLSDETINGWATWPNPCGPQFPPVPNSTFVNGAKRAIDFYENLITSGELRVVKMAEIIPRDNPAHGDDPMCSLCRRVYAKYEEIPPERGEFCKCGALIVKA